MTNAQLEQEATTMAPETETTDKTGKAVLIFDRGEPGRPGVSLPRFRRAPNPEGAWEGVFAARRRRNCPK